MRGSLALAGQTSSAETVVNAAEAASLASFMATVDRIEALVQAETDALLRNVRIDMVEINRRKRHGLLELSRSLRGFSSPGSYTVVCDRLGRFSVTLDRNRLVLDSQLSAVREIAEIIAHSIREGESDGTYSPLTARQ